MFYLSCPYCGKPVPVKHTVRPRTYPCPACGGHAVLSVASRLKISAISLAALAGALVVVRLLGVRDTTTVSGFTILAVCLTGAFLWVSWLHRRTPPAGPLMKVTGHRNWPD